MKVITIGKDQTATHRLTDARVSGLHAKLTLHSENKILVEDNQSTNGTYINGAPVFRKEITVNDTLVLVKPTVEDGGILINLKQFFAQTPTPPVPVVLKGFEDTLPELKRIYNQFKVDKDAIADAHSRKVNMLRAGMIIVPPLVSLLLLSKENKGFAALIGAASSALSMMLTGGMSPKDELEKVGEDFQITYKCQVEGCRRGFLGMVSPTVLEANRQCPCGRCAW